MQTKLLICLVLTVVVTVQLCSADNTKTTRKWAIKPGKAAYGPTSVDANTNTNQNVAMNVNKANVAATADVQGKGTLDAKKGGSNDQAQANAPGGKQASGDQTKKAQGVRTAQAGKQSGEMDTAKNGNDKTANLKEKNGRSMNTVVHGKVDDAQATGSKGHVQKVDPSAQSKTEGTGTIERDGKKNNYKETKSASGDTTAQMDNVGVCQGQKVGVSNCVNKNGQKVGEVVAQQDGTVIVKKTIAKGVDVPIGKAKVSKTSDGKSQVVVSDGLAQAQAGNYKERDCMSDYGKKASKVKAQKPFSFKYNSQKSGDKTVFSYPDCFTFGGKITLDPGVDANRLAIQMDAKILPAGQLKCVDAASCNKDCYYCNICNNSRKLDGMANVDSGNLCSAKGGGTYDVAITVCPPPEAFAAAQCSGFTKSDPNYFKKKGDIQATIKFFLRPANEVQKTQEFYDKLRGDFTGLVKKTFTVQFSVDNKNFINANNPTDFDLKEWYIHKYGGADEIVGCVEGTTNYTLTGQKINTSFLLEAGSLAAAPKSLFDTKQCPKVDAINTAEANDEAAQAKAKAGPSKNIFGSFGRR